MTGVTQEQVHKIAWDTAPAQIYWKDAKGIYLGCNQHMANLFYLDSPQAIIGKTDYDFFLDSALVQAILSNDQEVIFSKQTQTFEEIGTDAQKNLTWYLSTKAPLKNKEGAIIGVIGVSIDITRQKKAEAVKEEFLANMSHDLRTPFCSALGISQMLYQKEEDPAKKELQGYVSGSLEILLKIINEIIEMNHLKQWITQVKRFDIKTLLEEISTILQPLLTLKNLRLSLECAPLVLRMDHFKLRRILLALITNAIQFTAKGLIQVRVTAVSEKLFFTVQDTGIGLSESQLQNIFTAFYKTKPSYKDNSYMGLGNGLYITKELALQLNGDIQVESVLGKGSLFTLTLPLVT